MPSVKRGERPFFVAISDRGSLEQTPSTMRISAVGFAVRSPVRTLLRTPMLTVTGGPTG